MSLGLMLDDFDREVIETLHRLDGRQEATAMELQYSRGAIAGRIRRIVERTGLDPRVPEDRIQLLDNSLPNTGYQLTWREKQIILVTCECDMNLSEVMRNLHIYRSSRGYYLDTIKQKTGLSIRKFDDLIKLRKIVRGE